MEKVIPPTTGRRVLVFIGGLDSGGPQAIDLSKPFDGGIAYVHDDTLINVGYADHLGLPWSATGVQLLDRACLPSDGHGRGVSYAVWMPFQFEQALRALQPKNTEPQQAQGGYAAGAPGPAGSALGAVDVLVGTSLDSANTASTTDDARIQTTGYADGTTATGPGTLPTSSPAEQDATSVVTGGDNTTSDPSAAGRPADGGPA